MKVEIWPLGKLRPYAQNNKTHTEAQVERIAESIKRYGWTQPIAVDEEGEILVGHGRRLAAIRMGLETCPVVVVADLSETDKRAYRIIDNKLSDDAPFDMNNLGMELRALKDASFDLETFGLQEFDFDFLKPPPEPKEEALAEEPAGEWAAVLKLTVPAETIDHFEPELDELLRKYVDVKKERKEKK